MWTPSRLSPKPLRWIVPTKDRQNKNSPKLAPPNLFHARNHLSPFLNFFSSCSPNQPRAPHASPASDRKASGWAQALSLCSLHRVIPSPVPACVPDASNPVYNSKYLLREGRTPCLKLPRLAPDVSGAWKPRSAASPGFLTPFPVIP